MPLKKSRIFGGILLVAGNCIGAGMLGLPVVTGAAGFYPSLVLFILCWLFMMATGLLLLEVNLALGEKVSLISMAHRTLGKWGKWVSWGVYLFLFYCLMVAYLAAGGELFNSVLQGVFPSWIGTLLLTLFFGALVYAGTHAVDKGNRWLMGGLVVSFAVLLFIGAPSVKTALLRHHQWKGFFLSLPILITSFGFHNIIPSITSYFHAKSRPLKWAVILGSALPLVAYITWEVLVLGTVPVNALNAAWQNGDTAVQALQAALGHSWIATAAEYFAFFALVTSFLAVALSFVHFLSDGLKVKETRFSKFLLCLAVFLPPLVLSLIYPEIFLIALGYAGGIGAMILYAILPALMVWVKRYQKGWAGPELVFGGRPLLVLVILLALGILTLQLSIIRHWA